MDHGSVIKKTRQAPAGFTLFETLMSLVLLLLLAGVSYPLFSSSKTLLAKHRDREEVVQNGRIVLRRLVKEARYATAVYSATTGALEIGSAYLVDSDSGEERVRYRLQSGSLLRAVDSGIGYGAEIVMAEKVTSFSTSYNATTKLVTVTVSTATNGKTYADSAQVRPRSL